MPLTTALFTGLAGLTVNQVALDVIGNNIANVNTTAFKSSRALFDPQFSETTNFGTPPSAVYGGSNATQKGLGAIMKAVQRNFGSGNIQPTGIPSDLAIQGDGMFILQSDGRVFSRNGAFQINSAHYLVNPDGYYVMGYAVDSNFNILPGQLQRLSVPLGQMTVARATSTVTMGGSLASGGELATAGTTLQSQTFTNSAGGAVTSATNLVNLRDAGSQAFIAGSTLQLRGQRGGREQALRTLDVTATTTVQDLMDFVVGGFGIHADPALAGSPGAAVVATTGGYALAITGNAGEESALSVGTGGLQAVNSSVSGPLLFNQTAAAVGESVFTSMEVYDSLGNPLQLNVTAALESYDQNNGTTWRFFVNSPADTDSSTAVGTGTISFDSMGRYRTATGTTVSIDRDGTGAITPLTVTLDLSGVQGLTVLNSTLNAVLQDGQATGTLSDFGIGGDGRIVGTFTNGMTQTLGQVALATFSNYEGLVEVGDNTYKPGANSGTAVVGAPLESGAGAVVSSALETSNVDISNEFINMIIASTGFSAASRVITTSNELLTELLGLMRQGQLMIRVTRLNNRPMIVNAELIKFIENTPDTMLTLTTGEKILVRESLQELVERAIEYGRRIRCFAVAGADENEAQAAADR